jgi:hypothetical protein
MSNSTADRPILAVEISVPQHYVEAFVRALLGKSTQRQQDTTEQVPRHEGF